MRDELISVCVELDLKYKTHDSHGFYIDVWPKKEPSIEGVKLDPEGIMALYERINQDDTSKLMLDASPENVWKDGVLLKSYPKGGLLVVRDHTHHWARPTHLAEFDMDGNGIDDLKQFLKGGYKNAIVIDSLTGDAVKS